ncbi:hypothetical protein BDD12DRAFT_240830 [Trichophaea hybrida]|nr:hypothetical protein BDD12DRAFT_240830 [Trichophaea hybrida]
MATFTYPFNSLLLCHLSFWDTFTLSLTNRTIRQTLLQHLSAFAYYDLRDEYAASALTRAIERHNMSLPSTHTWADIYKFHEFFLIASEDSKKFRGRDYISATLKTRLLRECLGARVETLVLDGIDITQKILEPILKVFEPTVQVLSLAGVR